MVNYITSSGVQQWQITIASGSLTGSYTLPLSVGTGAVVLFDGCNPSVANNPAEDFANITFNRATGVITATRNTSTAGTIVLTGCCIDGDTSNLIKSVQYFTHTIANTSTSSTQTITAVTNANTAVHLLGWSSPNTTYSGINENPIVTLSGTTLTFSRQGSTGTINVSAVVIEFWSGALNQSVQNVAATISTSVTSYTASLTSVVMANTMCFYAGSNIATSTTNVAQIKQRGALTSSTQFTVSVNTAVANAKKYNCSVVEFVSGVLASMQRNTTTVTAALSNATALSSGVLGNTALSWLGNTTSATTAVLNQAEGQAILGPALPAHVQDVGSQSAGNPTSETITASTAGNLLIVVIDSSTVAGSVTSVSDNKSQTWIQVPGAIANGSTGFVDIWYVPNTVAGVTTVTVNVPGGGLTTPNVYEVSGIALTSPIDAVAVVNSGGSTASITSAAITTTSAGDFILSAFIASFAASAVTNGYTLASSQKFSAYKTPSGTVTSDTTVFTIALASAYACSTVAFLSAGGNAVLVQKSSATANITGSWEAAEFAAFSASGSVARWSASASLSAHGASLFNSIAIFSPHTVLSAIGRAAIKNPASWNASVSLNLTGRALKKTVAAWSASTALSAVGKSLDNSIATWAPHTNLSAVGAGLHKSVATFSPSAVFSAKGNARIPAIATWSASGVFSARGAALKKTVASWNASVSFLAISPPVGHTVTWSGHTNFNAIGKSSAKSSAVINASASFSPKGAVKANSNASWLAHAAFSAVGSSKKTATVSFSASTSLAFIAGDGKHSTKWTSHAGFGAIGTTSFTYRFPTRHLIGDPFPQRVKSAYLGQNLLGNRYEV